VSFRRKDKRRDNVNVKGDEEAKKEESKSLRQKSRVGLYFNVRRLKNGRTIPREKVPFFLIMGYLENGMDNPTPNFIWSKVCFYLVCGANHVEFSWIHYKLLWHTNQSLF
jgi:hypothetical protein